MDTHYYYKTNNTERQQQMLKWVEEDLIEANLVQNKQKRPWIIAIAHKPLYCSTPAHPDVQRLHDFYQPFEDLLFKYNVDLMFNGHIHYYER
jgi:hypothetical protein